MASNLITRRASRKHKQSAEEKESRHSFVFPTELGWIAICWTSDRFCGFALGHPSAAAAQASFAAVATPCDEPPAFVRRLATRMQEYTAGQPDDFRDVDLDLSHLTDFQRRVVEQCRRIRPGYTLTYGTLAEKAGNPGAARAVGNTMAQNRFPIVVPCHRVVGSAGSLGGFSAPSGTSLKRRLLILEGAAPARPVRPR